MFAILLVGPLLLLAPHLARTPAFPARIEVGPANTTWFDGRGAPLGHTPRIAPPVLAGERVVCTNMGPAVCSGAPRRDEMRAHTYVNWPACVRWACVSDPPHKKVVAAEMPRDQKFDPSNFNISIIK
jgi:hypothetical protein